MQVANNGLLANLSDAQLKGAVLTSAQLDSADLTSAQLQGAELSQAQLQGADLQYARLDSADLSRARLQGVKNLTIEQLSKVKTLVGAHFDSTSYVYKQIVKNYPQLLAAKIAGKN